MEEFVATKSSWRVVSFLKIVLCLLIIPLIVLIFQIIAAKKEKITFYSDKVIIEKGWFNTSKTNIAFTGVFSVTVRQNLWGKIFNYGDVIVDLVGKNDLNTTYIKNPNALANYLETRIIKKEDVVTHMH